MAPLLRLTDVRKTFGGLVAVNALSFEIEAGGIVAMIGPNGAGKSTVFNLITGVYEPTSGSIDLDGRTICGMRTHAIASLGIARTFQNIRLFAFMSALENVMTGQHVRMHAQLWDSLLHTPRQRAEERLVRERARGLLTFVGLEKYANNYAHNLAYGLQRRLEIARALAAQPAILLLDEPAAGMNPAETHELREVIRAIAAGGTGVLLVEHDMSLVSAVCDSVVVLNFGEVIATGTPTEVARNPAVIEAYLGTSEA
ncbi:MAG: ABC transporter ATP-binding protein [Candidatus Baltobacteraceae bacterium]